MAKIIAGPGLKNWKSNPKTAVKVARVDGPAAGGMFPGVHTREHSDGHVDGRVGGSYVDPETEERWRKGLIVVSGIQPVTLADLEAAMLVAKKKYREHPDDPKLKAAYRQIAQDLSAARVQLRQVDPRRIAAEAARAAAAAELAAKPKN